MPTGSEGFRAKIGDLGLAKIAYIEDDEGCSGVRGTWGYMSPELVASKMQRWLSDQGSKNRPSPIRLGRVVTASLLTVPSPISDTRLSSESV